MSDEAKLSTLKHKLGLNHSNLAFQKKTQKVKTGVNEITSIRISFLNQ